MQLGKIDQSSDMAIVHREGNIACQLQRKQHDMLPEYDSI